MILWDIVKFYESTVPDTFGKAMQTINEFQNNQKHFVRTFDKYFLECLPGLNLQSFLGFSLWFTPVAFWGTHNSWGMDTHLILTCTWLNTQLSQSRQFGIRQRNEQLNLIYCNCRTLYCRVSSVRCALNCPFTVTKITAKK